MMGSLWGNAFVVKAFQVQQAQFQAQLGSKLHWQPGIISNLQFRPFLNQRPSIREVSSLVRQSPGTVHSELTHV